MVLCVLRCVLYVTRGIFVLGFDVLFGGIWVGMAVVGVFGWVFFCGVCFVFRFVCGFCVFLLGGLAVWVVGLFGCEFFGEFLGFFVVLSGCFLDGWVVGVIAGFVVFGVCGFVGVVVLVRGFLGAGFVCFLCFEEVVRVLIVLYICGL